MKKLAIFASGSGSNFEAIVKAVQRGEISAEIVLLVCDQPDAYVLERAKNFGIPTLVLSPKDDPTKAAYEAKILEKLQALEVDLIVLAGYMRLVGETLLSAYPDKMVNIHPSKLPDFPGKDAISRAYESGARESGVTVHYVDAGMDTGPIIAQEVVAIDEGDTVESLEEKIHKIEHALYVRTLARLCHEDQEVSR